LQIADTALAFGASVDDWYLEASIREIEGIESRDFTRFSIPSLFTLTWQRILLFNQHSI
jgi:hypothetical protein